MPRNYRHAVYAAAKRSMTFQWMWNALLFWAALLFPCDTTVVAGQPVSTAEREQINQLIAALRSPNKPPSVDEEGTTPPRYLPGYNHAVQGRVLAARDALLTKGMAAFSQLITHAGDRHYSHTEQREKTLWINVDVGYVCRHLVVVQVEVYRPLVNLLPQERIWVPLGQDNLENWWETHKDLTLREIQLEGAKWAFGRQSKADFRDEDERTAKFGDLKRLIRRLETSPKPIQVDDCGQYVDERDLKPTRLKR